MLCCMAGMRQRSALAVAVAVAVARAAPVLLDTHAPGYGCSAGALDQHPALRGVLVSAQRGSLGGCG